MAQIRSVDAFLNDNIISEYTYHELSSYFKNNGFEIVDIKSDSAANCFDTLGISRGERDDFFVCCDKDKKFLFADLNADNAVLCFHLSRLIFLSNEKDSRLVDEKRQVDAVTFAVLLKERIESGYDTKVFKLIKYIGAVICLGLILVGSIFTGIVYYSTEADYSTIFNDDYKESFAVTTIICDSDDEDSEQVISDNNDFTAISVDDFNETDDIDLISDENAISSNNTLVNEDIEENSKDNPSSDLSVDVNSVTYYVTKSGQKYHVEGCRYIKNPDDCKMVSSDVAQQSYQPCKVCIK